MTRFVMNEDAQIPSEMSRADSWLQRSSLPGRSRARRSDGGPSSSGQIDPGLAEIVEEFTQRLQAGEAVEIDEYIAAYPEWAEILRGLLTDLRGLAALDRSASPDSPARVFRGATSPPALFGDFAIGSELGRGGMGVVYEAEQLSLGRRVALKVLSSAAALDARSLQRFQIEAQAAACLNHDHIVPVHAVGSHDDVPFYAMQYIEGASLAGVISALRRLRDGSPPPGDGEPFDPARALALDLLTDRFKPGRSDATADPNLNLNLSAVLYVRAAVRLAAQAADALEHAHDQGILHRDIKPANLLLDHAGKLWVTDFGLARMIGSGTLTATGDLPGTLRYMSPEQALGKRSLVDRRSDVYALGATIYELLTLKPAIDGRERWEILARIAREEPAPLRRRNPAVPVDLATIVAKAMVKDVAARYQTAGELADDLNSFLDGRPIKARPASAWEQFVLWCRRNTAVAGLIAALIAVVLAGFATTIALWNRANQTARRELALRVAAQAEIAVRDVDRGLELARRGYIDQALPLMVEAIRRAPPGRPELQQIARANLAAWEGQAATLEAILEHRGPVARAAFAPDGKTILTGSNDGTAQMWDVDTGQSLGPALEHGSAIHSIAFAPDGQLVLTGGSDGRLRLWNVATGQLVFPPMFHGESVSKVSFSRDGRLFLSYGPNRTARLWNTASGKPVGELVGPGNVGGVKFSPDSKYLVTAGFDGAARFWDTTTARSVGPTFHHGEAISVATLSPDASILATGGCDGTVRLWDAISGASLVGPLQAHGATVARAVFSPDGKFLLTTSVEGSARLWNVLEGRPIRATVRHDGEIVEAKFSPSGKRILTASGDNTARLWDVATGRPIGSPLRHRLSIKDVAFSPDGTMVVTASDDGTAKLWKVANAEMELTDQWREARSDEKNTSLGNSRSGISYGVAAFSPDRTLALLGSSRDGIARLVDTANGQPVSLPILQRWSRVRAIAFSPDGQHFAIASHNGDFREGGSTGTTCQIWSTTTGQPTSPLLPHINYVSALAFRPDGKALATGDYSGAVHLWDVTTGEALGSPRNAGSIVVSVAFSPDGRTLVAGTTEPANQAILWDLDSGAQRGEAIRFKGSASRLDFSPDGLRLAIGSSDNTVRLIDVSSGAPIGGLLQHPATVHGVAFSPDGGLLLTTYGEATGISSARLWNVKTGLPCSAIMTHGSQLADGALAFSPDGTLVGTGCNDGSVHLWHVASARPIGPPHMLHAAVIKVAFSSDSRSLMAADERGHVHTWHVAEPANQSFDQLIGRLQSRTGLELDPSQEIAVLEPGSWRRRHAQLEGKSPQSAFNERLAWHEARARDAEEVADGFGACWHIDRLIAARPGDRLLHARRARAFLLSDDLASAEADLVVATAQGADNRIFEWLTHAAVDLRASGRPADALIMLDHAIAACPADWRLDVLRAEILGSLARGPEREAELARAVDRGADISFLIRLAADLARSGDWRSAARLYRRAIDQGTVPYEVWQQAALAHLQIGDDEGYRRLCDIMRGRFPTQIAERWVAASLAEVCTLGPGGIGNDGKALEWTNFVLATIAGSRVELAHSFIALHGATLYRLGRFREAIDRINQGIAAGDGQISPVDSAYLAMSYSRCGDDLQAHKMLARMGTDEPSITPEDYWTITANNRLRDEARRLVANEGLPDNHFAD